MKPLVSIVINNYNYDRFVREAIESALAQTYDNCEVVIVDDGSTDGSRPIIEEYGSRIRVLLQENAGQASAFNTGIRAARGEYVLLLDSDDYVYPEAVETCLKSFPEHYSRVYFQLKVIDENGTPIDGSIGIRTFRTFDGDVMSMLRSEQGHWAPPTSANFYRASILKSILPVPEKEYKICADLFVNLRTFFLGSIRSIDSTLGAYRIHGQNSFASRRRLLSDKKILRARIEHDALFQELLKSSLEESGHDSGDLSQMDGDAYVKLQFHIAAKKLGIETPYLEKLSDTEIFQSIFGQVLKGKSGLLKGASRTVFLLLLFVAPEGTATKILRLKDWWGFR